MTPIAYHIDVGRVNGCGKHFDLDLHCQHFEMLTFFFVALFVLIRVFLLWCCLYIIYTYMLQDLTIS